MIDELQTLGLFTCADAEVGAICICLALLAMGFRPRPFHEDLNTVAIVGHISVDAESAFYMTVSCLSMTQYRNPWQNLQKQQGHETPCWVVESGTDREEYYKLPAK
jgi:hypothetical protein